MKTSTALKSDLKSVSSNAIISIKAEMERIRTIYETSEEDVEFSGALALPNEIFLQALNDQESEFIGRIRINSNSLVIDSPEVGYDIKIDDADVLILIGVLEELEQIQTINDIELF